MMYNHKPCFDVEPVREPDWFDKMSPKGRTTLIVLVFVLFGLAYFAIPADAGQAQERPKFQTPEQAQVSAREKAIRLRAEQIRLEKELEAVEKELQKGETPEERQARKEVEEVEKKTTEAEKRARKAIANSGLQGCDPSTIQVHPDVAPYRSISSTVKIQVFNPEPLPVDIYDPKHGLVVQGLCAGGSITLFRARRLWDPDYIQFRFIARAMLPDGRMALAESQSYQLSKYDWQSGRGRQEDSWVIQLRPVAQVTR